MLPQVTNVKEMGVAPLGLGHFAKAQPPLPRWARLFRASGAGLTIHAEHSNPDGEILILASSSPRRQELLREIGVPFQVHAANINEDQIAGEAADRLRVASGAGESAGCGGAISAKLCVGRGHDCRAEWRSSRQA